MPSSSSEAMSRDDVFDILSNARRRYVLYYLREAGEPVELGELARELAAWENDTSPAELTKQQRKRVYVSLYQTHIQKLADADIVEYDDDTRMVSLANGTDELGSFLSGEDDGDDSARWQRRYLGLAAVSAVVYSLVVFDVFAFGQLSALLTGIGIVVAFAVLAVAHYLQARRRSSEIPTDSLIHGEP